MRLDTLRRINLYKKRLPGMKEKLTAAGVALLIATVIGATASYAWITLSRAPETSGLATTLSANGALEIALCKDDGTAPSDADYDESVGISSDVTVTNLQWGNLINISDSRYGIDDLSLRPAQLNTAALATSPLWGSIYGADGRITTLNSNYTYTAWDTSEKKFIASTNRGVRAISSYTKTQADLTDAAYEVMYQSVLNAHEKVNSYYSNNFVTTDNMNNLGSVVSTYLQSMLNQMGYGQSNGDKDLALTTTDLTALYNALNYLHEAMELEKTALVSMANLQQYYYAKVNGLGSYTEVTWDDLKSNAQLFSVDGSAHVKNPTTAEEAISLTNLITFIGTEKNIAADVSNVKKLVERSDNGETIRSSAISAPVDHLIATDSLKYDGYTIEELKELKDGGLSGKFKLLGLLTGDRTVVVYGGAIYDFEQIAADASCRLPYGTSTNRNQCTISVVASYADYGITNQSFTINGHLSTGASGSSNFSSDYAKVPSELNPSIKVAEDTYGMAVDFWVRSNQEQTYLTLEGATVIDTDGTILSYDGINRIWGATGNTALTTNSTTQGGGSCYTYYADTPEDMSRSLELLQSMKVAFVSQDGELLATATMDTKHYYAVNGRVTVPLIISEKESVSYTNTDDSGEEITSYAIQSMTLDRAYLITAVVYLDGATLTNTDVLAAGDIQGQLNIQFGSSEQMTTVGDNKLLTAERSVSASVSKSEFDYDVAESAADLTTTVTVNIEGSVPQTVQAFFVRAVNSTQGERQGMITFTKQADGSWKGDYAFELPGTYYLRYVRLDRVDYALEDPCSVYVSGFAVSSVDWGEGAATSKDYYSTDSSYTESVSVKFATTDATRVPTSVEARFIRDDGNAVNVETKYNPATQTWDGTGTFTASGNYTLSYLVLNGNYYDVGQFKKTLNLHMGLKAAVYNNNSSTSDKYDSTQPDLVRDKHVQVRILDSAGASITGLVGMKLYYANGGSMVNGVDTDLTWNDATKYYDGTLPIVKAGRYNFSQLTITSGSTITKVTESPTYVVAPPNAPVYDATSASLYHGDNVNFIPLKANATIGPIKISDSASAQAVAVVYNSETKDYTDVTMNYVPSDGGYWMVNLPTYLKGETAIQDGTWQVVCMKLWDCFDGTANDDNYRSDEDHAMIWLGNTAEATAYAKSNSLTADQTIDFSLLATTVSCTVNVQMTSGDTGLGSKSADFMTTHKVADIGMSVAITDDAGRNIPAAKLGQDGEVKLTIQYTANTDADKYGYEVKNFSRSYPITFTQDDNGTWTPDSSSNYTWQYVGEYTVTDLKVTVGSTTKTFTAGTSGVPTEYTVKSKAPTVDNLEIASVTQEATTYGKTGDTVDGKFLASYTPRVTTVLNWKVKDVNGYQYAMVPGMSVEVTYTYLDGTTAPNGNYSWSGTTGYESYTDTVTEPTNDGESYTFTNSGSHTLLAGRYSTTATLKWKDGIFTKSETLSGVNNLEVWSVTPSVEITDITPASSVTVNTTMGESGIKTANASTFTAQNTMGDSNVDGKNDYAVVYMQYEVGQNGYCAGTCSEANNDDDKLSGTAITTNSAQFANYTAPEVTMELSNAGSYTADLEVSGTDNLTYSFNGDSSVTKAIGTIITGIEVGDSHSYKYDYWFWTETGYCAVTYPTETQQLLGTKQMDTITSTVDGKTYIRTLTEPITIIQEAEKNECAVTWSAPEGLDVTVKVNNQPIANGQTVSKLSRVAVTLKASTEEYYNPKLTKPSGITNWSATEGTSTSSYSFTIGQEALQMFMDVSAYPSVSWGASEASTVEVKAGGTAISSGKRIVPGTAISMTVTRGSEEYYDPRLTAPANVSDWTVVSETQTSAKYSFTMPNESVAIAAPAVSEAPTLTWTSDKVTVSVAGITNGAHVLPGTKVTATLDAGSNGTAPRPSGVDDATCATPEASRETATILTWTFYMPAHNVEFKGVCTKDTVLNLVGDIDESKCDYTITVDNTFQKANGDGVKAGHIVAVALTAKDGYYNPSIARPASIEAADWSETTSGGTYYTAVTYQFTMPADDLNLTVNAPACPTVNFAGTNETITVKKGTTAITSGSKVFPGTTLTATAASDANYYNPVLSATGATLSGSDSTPYFTSATRTLAVGTQNINLSGEAALKPSVTYSAGASFKNLSTSVTSGSYVMPGTTLTFTATPGDDYYFPTSNYSPVTKSSGDGMLTLYGAVAYASATYKLVVGTQNTVIGTNSATQNPTVTYAGDYNKAGAALSGGASFTFSSTDKSVKVRPGTSVTLTLSATDKYYWPTATAVGANLSGQTVQSTSDYARGSYTFTMGTSAVTLTGTAIDNPTLTINHGNISNSFTYNGYIKVNNTEYKTTTSYQVRPSTNIAFTEAKNATGFWRYSTAYVAVTGGYTKSKTSSSFNFQMPTSNVTITGYKS